MATLRRAKRFDYSVSVQAWTWCSSDDFGVPDIWLTDDVEEALLVAGWMMGSVYKVSDGYVVKSDAGCMVRRTNHQGDIMEALKRGKNER